AAQLRRPARAASDARSWAQLIVRGGTSVYNPPARTATGRDAVAKRIRVRVDGVTAEGRLYEEKAPKTVASLWSALPIRDRTIQVRWSGEAWRTENNYELLPADAPVENAAGRLEAG